MEFPKCFICARKEYSTLSEHIPAPYLRRSFTLERGVRRARLCITGLGFYEAYINGVNITKGAIAPYRSNIDHIVYYDCYDIKDRLTIGVNTLGIILGNGMRNALGAYTWDLDKAGFRGAPATAFSIEIEDECGCVSVLESDEQTLTAPSPIVFDDLHFGEYYDARRNIRDWCMPSLDDSEWSPAIKTEPPLGEARLCEAEPIRVQRRLKPISVTPYENGYIYDFGCNVAGVCTLRIRGERGQRVILRHFEGFYDSSPELESFRYGGNDRVQEDEYILCGEGEEEYTPRFTYHGFRYVYAEGVSEEQATEGLLTYLVLSSALERAGEFWCSSDTVNKIQEATLNSDIANFYYFPTDCPQREKNGWSADASLSAEQMLLNFTPEHSYREWMRNIYMTLTEQGQLPGIIPTSGWGYHWGNGPAWDSVIVNLPYYTYIYRGDRKILEELSAPLKRYLEYLSSKRDQRGLVEIGLGDWCQPNTPHSGAYTTPLAVTDTIVSFDIAKKAEFIYGVLGMDAQCRFAKELAHSLREAFREHLLDRDSAVVFGETQSAQAMAIYYGLLETDEKKRALDVLLRYIASDGEHFNTGVLGGRVIFRVLADNGYASLAYRMITRDDHPSYGNWIKRGATSLWEAFRDEPRYALSMNHHFWGDVSAWFYTYLAGIKIDPDRDDCSHVDIMPCFIDELSHVRAYHITPKGRISVEWEREGDEIILNIERTSELHGSIMAIGGYVFDDGTAKKELCTAKYRLRREIETACVPNEREKLTVGSILS